MADGGGGEPAAKRQKAWHVVSSNKAKNTTNPIRKIVDKIVASKKDIPGKKMIPFMLGDPTAFGNLFVPQVFVDALCRVAQSKKANGYGNSVGLDPARAAIAKAFSIPNRTYTPADIFIASGCSGALEVAINGLLNPGDNMLIPNPAFSLYEVLATSHGASVKTYRLDPSKQWQVDVSSLEAAIDENTKAILVNNPSNPCGSVLPEANLRDIIDVARRHRLPIVADEIYGEMCFSGFTFHPLASLSEDVPVISAGGIAKQFLVPGWRVGWLMVHDPIGVLDDLRDGLQRLTTLIVGANTIVQQALPAVLDPEPGSQDEADLKSSHSNYMRVLEENGLYTAQKLAGVPGIEPVTPQGAMYVMVQIKVEMFKDVNDDADFTRLLLAEENVFVLPGQCFGIQNFVRLVICAPKHVLEEGYNRIIEFCHRHTS